MSAGFNPVLPLGATLPPPCGFGAREAAARPRGSPSRSTSEPPARSRKDGGRVALGDAPWHRRVDGPATWPKPADRWQNWPQAALASNTPRRVELPRCRVLPSGRGSEQRRDPRHRVPGNGRAVPAARCASRESKPWLPRRVSPALANASSRLCRVFLSGRCVDAMTGEWVEPGGPAASPTADACSHRRHGKVQRVHRVRVSAAGGVEVEISGGASVPSDTYNLRLQPQRLQAGMSGGSVAWQSRKRSATDAVKERLLQPQRTPPSAPPASPTAGTLASQQQPAAPVAFRQPQLGAFFSAAPAPAASPSDSMDTLISSSDSMDTD